MTVAALYVAPGGCYYDLEGVEPWGCRSTPEQLGACEPPERDARLYAGPWPVVAHPPCTRWCRLAGLVEARYPQHKRGEDGGCFAAALAAVRRWGGVLEHPAYSDAWAAFNLNAPPTGGGWVNADFQGGWTCYIEQWRYGHPAKKATWLYAVAPQLPQLEWGLLPDGESRALVSWCGNHTTEARMMARIGDLPTNGVATAEAHHKRRRLSSKAASATPPAFRDMLLDIPRSCSPP
jgi:hypothetical protein